MATARDGIMAAEWLRRELDEACDLHQRVREDADFIPAVERICAAVVSCFKNGSKVLTFGNGGSAADAMHLSEELVGRYRGNRPPLPAVCLSADGSALTCIANDFGIASLFARQVQALCQPGDVAVAFSTSGSSENLVEGLKAARARGGLAVGILGRDGGPALACCDLAVVVPHANGARIQEVHTLILHCLCEAVEAEFK